MYSFLVCKFADHTGVERRETGQIIYTAFRLDGDGKKIQNSSVEGLDAKDLAENMIERMKAKHIKNWEVKNYNKYPQEDVKSLDEAEYELLLTTLSLAKL